VLVVSDRVEVLEPLVASLQAIENQESAVWVVQLHLVGWSRTAAKEFGIDVEPTGRIAAGLALGAAGVGPTINGQVGLDATLRLADRRDDVSVVAAPMLVLLDGERGEFVQGDRLPVPRRTSEALPGGGGTVSTQSFEYVQTGVTVTVNLREQTARSARVELDVRISNLRELIEGAPRTGEERLQTVAVMEAGGVYLLGSLARERRSGGAGLGLQAGDYEGLESQLIQVWAETFRVAGPAVSSGRGVQVSTPQVSAAEDVSPLPTQTPPAGARPAGGVSAVDVTPWSGASEGERGGDEPGGGGGLEDAKARAVDQLGEDGGAAAAEAEDVGAKGDGLRSEEADRRRDAVDADEEVDWTEAPIEEVEAGGGLGEH
jgi:hypothetical protein